MTSSPQKLKEEEAKEDKNPARCGWGSCQPRCLQPFNSPPWLLFGLTCFTIIQGFVVNGVVKTNTSTLERRFNLPSTGVGFIPAAYDLAAGLLGVPISYIGIAGHKNRILAVMALMMAAGSFLSVLPHFTTGLYQPSGGTTSELCHGNSTSCTEKSSGLSNYLYLFIAGNFLHGVGGAALYTLGAPLLDDNVPVKKSPIYIGVMYAGSGLGPALGYMIGGLLLNTYVDIDKLNGKPVGMTPSDPRWVGAWWIGFLVSGFLFLACWFWFSFYGRETPAAAEVRGTRVSQAYANKDSKIAERENFGSSIRDFPMATKIIVSNPLFILITIAGIVEAGAVSAFSTFMPKYMQNQFNLTAGTGAILAGIAVVPGAAGGHILAGTLLKCLKLKVRGILRFCSIMALSGCILSFIFLARCNTPNIAGVNTHYHNSTLPKDQYKLTVPCNVDCNCTTANYEPVCGVDKVQYFSPCYAGCASSSVVNGKKTYGNCACIPGMTSSNSSGVTREATVGGCGVDCSMVGVFMPFFFLLILVTFMSQNAGINATMRCIPESQRPFALGLQLIFMRFLGTVPAPILMGGVFDSACFVWQYVCKNKGSCWIYDSTNLSLVICVICLVVKFISFVFFTIAAHVYKAPEDENLLSSKIVNGGSENSIPVAYIDTYHDAVVANDHANTKL